jgi:hydrogenase nickel incorporation protein HypA/HybF
VHELSVCQALLNQVAEIAAARGAARVTGITIEVGPLAGVDPALLGNAFAIARAGSCAAGAALLIEAAAVEIACLSCGAHSRPAPNRLVCAGCGGFRTRVVAGEELRLRRVELQMSPLASAA